MIRLRRTLSNIAAMASIDGFQTEHIEATDTTDECMAIIRYCEQIAWITYFVENGDLWFEGSVWVENEETMYHTVPHQNGLETYRDTFDLIKAHISENA